MQPDPFISASIVFRLVLGAYFVLSGTAKLWQDNEERRQAIEDYRLLPHQLSSAVSTILPPLEVILGLAVLIGLATRIAAALTLCLLIVFTAAVALSVLRGQQHGCGCLGDLTVRNVSWGVVLQNTLLLIGATFIVLGPSDEVNHPLWELLRETGVDSIAMMLIASGLLALLTLWSYAEANADAYGAFRSYLDEH